MRSASETEGSPVAITARSWNRCSYLKSQSTCCITKGSDGEDAEAAISIMQRSLEEVGIDLSRYKEDIDLIMTGRPKSIRDRLSVILSVLMDMEKVTGIVEKEALVNELETKHKIPRAEERMITIAARRHNLRTQRRMPKENLKKARQNDEASTGMRLSTERKEAVEARYAKMVGTDGKNILATIEKAVKNEVKLPYALAFRRRQSNPKNC